MGDFFIDFRPASSRQVDGAATALKFFPDQHVSRFEPKEFGLVLVSPDEPRLWAPAESVDGNLYAGVSGRISLEQGEWEAAQKLEDKGGASCRHILKCYREGGIARVAELSGHFTILVYDKAAKKFFVVTDRWGIATAFQFDANGAPVLSSHPDVLADAVGERENWDLTSFAEFILTCKLSAPFSYYKKIQSLPFASVMTVALKEQGAVVESVKRYFDYKFEPQSEAGFEALAEELAAGFRHSLTKRTLPLLGPTAIALSGGLDSRTLLCSSPEPQKLISFCCHDRENNEFVTARNIASAVGVRFEPFLRGPDFYADNAEMGVRISGGMGSIASNHFLGFRDALNRLGTRNLITGCYCDYLFKALAFNKQVNRWTTAESVGRFGFSYYAGHSKSATPLARTVQERLSEQFPENLRPYNTEELYAEVEHRRTFPLSYEEDSAARSIPQRVMGWYPPVAENRLMDTRLKMTAAMKLNRRLFGKTVQKVCGGKVAQIPDANTGAAVNSPILWEAFTSHKRRVQSGVRKLFPQRSTAGSWLNWSAYITQSPKLRAQWERPNEAAHEVFRQVLDADDYHRDINAYAGRRLSIFLQLFTLKLWFDQRAR